MADQQKESSSVDSKDGSSPLEEGIGKGFPSSWKSISMADDDPLDFSFDCVSKGNKKTFNFDKLDMDFNLDGEFDKISSFKVDMSDLDFSSSPKKPAKSKKSKGGESSGAKEGKQDGFDFNFDFNELDSFNLDSLIKGDTTSTTNLNKKGLISDGSDSKGAKEPKPSDDEHVHASNDSNAMKPLAPEAETSEVEIRVGNKRDLGSTQEGSLSKVSSSGKLDMLIEATTPSGISKTSSTNEKDQERELYAKTNSTESKSQDSKNPPQSFGLNYSSEDTVSDQHTEVYSPGTKVINGSGGKQNVINNKVTNVSLDGVELLLENSSPLQIKKLEHSDGEATELGGSTQAEATNEPQPIKNGVSSENNSKTVVLKNILHDRDTKENQKATLDGHLTRASSKPVVDKVMLMKDKEIKGTKDVSFGCKGIGDMQLGSITKARESFKSNDSECGTKLVNDSTPATSKQVREELVLLGSKDDVKISSNTREGIVSDGNPSGGNFAGNVQPIHKEVKKSKTILLETDAFSKEVNLLSSQVTPSSLNEKTARHATQMPVNLQVQSHNSDKESFQNSRISIEGNKLPSIKAAKITPALSGFKTLKSIGTNKVLSTSIRQKEIKSSVNSEHMETQGITAPKSDNLVGSAEYQKPATSFLKRKANEVSEADLVHLRPLKRLFQSPSKSRSSKACPEKVVEQVDSRHNKSFCNSPNLLPSPPEMNLQMEVKLPASVLVEDNGNVEKAEAYTKQLEDICNLLKKKHEEAKELIVRAVVNNNNLLMLNHPIYEGKIRKVQKLALQLMSKRIQT